jgi:hypothetical protein
MGVRALFSDTIGYNNTAIGVNALYSNTTGSGNTATGFGALFRNTTGGGNTAYGNALFRNTTGGGNTAYGDGALYSNTTGNGNTALGSIAGVNVTTANNVIAIGSNVSGENVSNTCYIGNIFGVTSAGATAVYVNSLGKLGTVVSSRRFKDEIKPMDKASEAILSLRPVTFHYKTDTTGTAQFGLIAEEVAKVSPALVLPDKEGKPYTVRYDQVNAMLLNEFLKARRQIDAQQKQIEALTAGLQKVSAQLELSKAAPQTALNDQ